MKIEYCITTCSHLMFQVSL